MSIAQYYFVNVVLKTYKVLDNVVLYHYLCGRKVI